MSSAYWHGIDLTNLSEQQCVTLPAYMMAPSGLKLIKEFPGYATYIYTFIADLDD